MHTVGLGETLTGETRPDIGVMAGDRDMGELGVRDCWDVDVGSFPYRSLARGLESMGARRGLVPPVRR